MNLPNNFVVTGEEYWDKFMNQELDLDNPKDVEVYEAIEEVILMQTAWYATRRLTGGIGHISDEFLSKMTTAKEAYTELTGNEFMANSCEDIDY